MPLESTLVELEAHTKERIANAATPDDLEAVRVEVLGRKGTLAQVSKQMGKLAPEERARIGKLLNAAKQTLETALETRKAEFDRQALARAARCRVDRSDAPGARPAARQPAPHHADPDGDRGPVHLHGLRRAGRPRGRDRISQLRRAEYPGGPSRRATCRIPSGCTDGNLLRTHTSPVQVRGMERLGPPLRMIAPGRVFRNEEVDASHEHTFYQLEGMMIDREVSVAHLIYFMKTLLSHIFGREVTVRLRPGYFPFVEPGFELDIQCLICGGTGCPVCKQGGWVELLPCGLVNPNVLRMSGIDPEEWNGFAFGLGLTRLAMMRYGIDDIRHLQGGDLRFLKQF